MSDSIAFRSQAHTYLICLALILTGSGLLGCAQDSVRVNSSATPISLLPTSAKPENRQNTAGSSGRIVFVSTRDGPAEVYVMNADGANPHRLTFSEGGNDWPTFSPDGKLILYESSANGREQIYVMSADGKNPKNLAASQASDEFPAWSPDGTHIAFASDRNGHVAVYVMNADGSGVRLLTDHPSNNWFPAWSPDGSSIAFISDRDGTNGNIFLMDPAGNQIKQVTTETTLVAKPSWAPDSQHLTVFSQGGFFAITREGSNLIPITNDGEDPAWSPDGKWIAFASRRDSSNLQIYLTRPDGSSVERLTNSSGEDSEPAWGP